MPTTEAWAILKDFGIILNYLLIPIGVGTWRGLKFFTKMDKRITYLEILHKVKGCHERIPGVEEFNNAGGD